MSDGVLRILFIGEEPSKTATEKAWKWGDMHLCSKTLLEAFDAAGFPHNQANFENIFENGEVKKEVVRKVRVRAMSKPVVAMGKKVQKVLNSHGIPHIPMIHPAARGEIRKTENFQAHVQEVIELIREKYPVTEEEGDSSEIH